jgi:hypothetical protein
VLRRSPGSAIHRALAHFGKADDRRRVQGGVGVVSVHQERGARISCLETGKPDSNVTFRLEKTSVPSTALIYCGIPKLAQDWLVHSMSIGLIGAFRRLNLDQKISQLR